MIVYLPPTSFSATDGLWGGPMVFVPQPNGQHEQDTYLATLTSDGNGNFVFKKKFGTELNYVMVPGLAKITPADRIFRDMTDGLLITKFARLQSVQDKTGNALDYIYVANDKLTPSFIQVRRADEMGAFIAITKNDAGVVTAIRDPKGAVINYAYEDFIYIDPIIGGGGRGVAIDQGRKLAVVTNADNSTSHYEYSFGAQDDLSPNPNGDYRLAGLHFDLSKITDTMGHVYQFLYQFDQSKHNYSNSVFYPRNDLPRLISSVILPNGDQSHFSNAGSYVPAQVVGVVTSEIVRRSVVIDTLGNQRTYNFDGVQLELATGLTGYYVAFGGFQVPSSIFYTMPRITSYSGSGFSAVKLGEESFEFSPAAGMALSKATDFSGNTTTYQYGDSYSGPIKFYGYTIATAFGRFSDPTSQTNSLNQTRVFAYNAGRIMTASSDEADITTQWQVDTPTGRRLREIVTDNSENVFSETIFYYKDTEGAYLPPGISYAGISLNFLTKKVVKAKTVSSTDPAWVADLVTAYVPDANGRVWKEIVNPAGLALTTEYTYDANGNKLTSKDPRGNITTFAYDSRNRLTLVTYPDATTKQLDYDARGNKVKEVDENGVATLFDYDALNRVINQAIDKNGNAVIDRLADDTPDRTVDIVTSFTYNALNAKVTTTDPNGTVTKFEYDALQRLIKKTDDFGDGRLNYITTYEYGANSGGSVFASSGFKPTKVTDHRSYVTDVIYDKLYRPTEEKVFYAPGLYATTNKTYDAVGNLLTVTDPLGTVTKTTYDALKRPLAVTEAFGTSLAVTSAQDYTSTGLAWRTIADYGDTTRLNRETRTDYDAAGRPVKVYAPAVDDALTAATTDVSPMTETIYDAASNVSAVINPLGHRTDYIYDVRNRRTDEQQPAVTHATSGLALRQIRTTTYDAVGNVLNTEDARGYVTTTTYDPARRPLTITAPEVTKPDGTTAQPVTVMTYDKAGNVLTLTDANGHVTTNTYDALNRLLTTTQSPTSNSADNIVVQNEYDPAGNRTAVIDGKNQRTEFTYDGLNRNLTIKDPANRSVTFTYNALNKTTRLDSLGQTTSYAYDFRHRLTGVSYVVDGTHVDRSVDNRVYAYDALGQLLSVTEPNKAGNVANAAYTYDSLGRQLTETSGGKQHAYTYDLANNRITVTYGGTGTVLTSTYDVLNRLATLTENSRVTTYGYDLNGNRVFQSLPNGEEIDTIFDALNRQTAIVTTKNGGGTLLELAQAYDLVGNVARITESYPGSTLSGRTVVNTYDHVNRLTGETTVEGAKTTATTYAFDKANNRTAKAVATTSGSGTTVVDTAYVYNNLNQLQTATEGAAATAFSYDLNGNRATRTKAGQVDTYTYDYENRLVSLAKNTPGGAGTYAYVYDYRTRRVERTEIGTTTKSVFSGGLSIAEYVTPNYVYGPQPPTGYQGSPVLTLGGGSVGVTISIAPSVVYIRGSDWGGGVGGLLYSVRSGVPSYKHCNSRGDVISETNAAGARTWEGTYEAYGTRTQEVGSTQDRQKANTKEEDPTGLLNEGFRYRCLETGVFITRDPLGFVDGPNMYAYVVQNPWSKFDPLGLWETTITTEQAAKLPDSTGIINNYVNAAVKEAFSIPSSKLGSGGVKGEIAKRLVGGGIGASINAKAGGNNIQISRDIVSNNPANVLKGDVNGTRYDGALTLPTLFGPPMPASNDLINMGALAHGMNVNGNAIGTDKLDHMFGDGKDLSNTPTESARSSSENAERGLYGLRSSGVYSNADIEANMAGHKFYNDAEKAYKSGKEYAFDIRSFDLAKMDENKNPNTYSSRVEAKIKENEKKKEDQK